jgi:hypothetical protein
MCFRLGSRHDIHLGAANSLCPARNFLAPQTATGAPAFCANLMKLGAGQAEKKLAAFAHCRSCDAAVFLLVQKCMNYTSGVLIDMDKFHSHTT